MKCQFQETINEMKKFLNERLGNKFASDDTKDVIKGKLEEIAKLELQLRKLQGTVMVARDYGVEETDSGSKIEKKEVVKADTQAYNGKIDVTDPIASMKVLEERKLQKEKDREVLRMMAYSGWQVEKEMKDIHIKHYEEVSKIMRDISSLISDVKIKDNPYGALLEYTLESPKLRAGVYDKNTHSIDMYTLTDSQATEHAKELVKEQYMKEFYGDSIEDAEQFAVLANKLVELPDFREIFKEDSAQVAANIMKEFVSTKGSHTLTHELVHAGAVKFMAENPDDELTKRVEELYKHALEWNVAGNGSDSSEYWTKNVDEFLAEALTNPAVIYSMNQIAVKMGPRVTMFQSLIDTVLEMLGFEKDSTVYQEVLNTYMGILEKVMVTKEQKEGASISTRKKSEEMMQAAKQLLQGMKDC